MICVLNNVRNKNLKIGECDISLKKMNSSWKGLEIDKVKIRSIHKENQKPKVYKIYQGKKIRVNTSINRKYIMSKDYRKKFKLVEVDENISKQIARVAIKTLKHRQDTLFEDLYYIHSKTGKIMFRVDASKEEEVEPTEEMKYFVLDNINEIIAIHNHPNSSVPSLSDLKSARRYKYGLVVGHNGIIFKYSVPLDIADYDLDIINYRLDTLHDYLYNVRDNERVVKTLEAIKNHGVKIEVIQ